MMDKAIFEMLEIILGGPVTNESLDQLEHRGALRRKLEARFASVHLFFDVYEMEIILEALSHFPSLDLRHIDLIRESGYSYFDSYHNLMNIALMSTVTRERKDHLFTIIHELRHAEQFQKGFLSIDADHEDGGFLVWSGDWAMRERGKHVQHILKYDVETYQKLPWEADANGYASAVLGQYIPTDDLMAMGVKFGRIAF
jgi:hypothetical protein